MVLMNFPEENSIQIVIPTYNRFDKLISQVSRLKEQMEKNDYLMIYDNCSEYFDFKHELFMSENITVIQNQNNIGICGNIAKSFESVACEWLWIVGDDDPINKDAIKVIRNKVKELSSEFVLINFSSELMPNKRFNDSYAFGVKDYSNKIDSFSNQLLISNNVYHCSIVHQAASLIPYGISQSAPQIIPLIVALNENRGVLLATDSLVTWGYLDIDESWNKIPLFNLLMLIDHTNSKEKKFMFNIIKSYLPSLHYLTANLCFVSKKFNQNEDSKLFLRKISPYFITYGSFFDKIKILTSRVLIKFPSFSLGLYYVIYFLVKRKSMNKSIQNRKLRFYI